MSLKDIAYTKISLAELEALRAEIERLMAAIQATASQGTYDEIAIRKAVSFELAELIVDAHREPKP